MIGGYAAVIHGVNRTTGDMDILIEPTIENAAKVLAAIEEFGLGSIGFTIEDLTDTDSVVQMGRVPYRIDILNTIPGVIFEDAYNESKIYQEDEVAIRCIHINQLIENKKAVGRPKDLADVRILEKILKRKK